MLKFVWDEEENATHYHCKLYDDNEILAEISFTDYNCKESREYDKKNHRLRECAYEISYHGGANYRMRHEFDYDNEYDSHIDEKTGERLYGYNGLCTHTVDDVKRWCEEFMAQIFINDYKSIIKKLDQIKERHDWFVQRGYGSIDLENF